MAISDWKEGQEVESTLWLVSGAERRTKDGKPYWEGTLRDASGTLPAKLWDGQGARKGLVAEFLPDLEPGGAVRVKGRLNLYQGNLELVLQEVRALPSGDTDPGLFAPRSERETGTMMAEYDAVVASMGDEDFRRLLETFRARDDLFHAFVRAPAATVMHHAWVGGLLEHSLALCRNARAIAPNYPGIDPDLVITGCFFHDAGKALEISPNPGFGYTTDGRLFGHIYMGARLVESLMDSIPGFPELKRRHLLHLVLSHQGERAEGFGSPVDPATPEAILFHHLDNLDAKLQNCLSTLKASPAGREFTDARASSMRRSYYAVRLQSFEGREDLPEQGIEMEPTEEARALPEPQPGLFGSGVDP